MSDSYEQAQADEAARLRGMVQHLRQEVERMRLALQDAERRVKTLDDEKRGVAASPEDMALQRIATVLGYHGDDRANAEQIATRIERMGRMECMHGVPSSEWPCPHCTADEERVAGHKREQDVQSTVEDAHDAEVDCGRPECQRCHG